MPDFLWGIAVSGSWDDASNWSDTSTGQTPALVAPGSNDSVTVNAVGDGAARVITGTGNSASLTLNGATVLAGQFTTGALSQAYNQTLQLNAGDELTITGNASFGTSTNSSIINLTERRHANGRQSDDEQEHRQHYSVWDPPGHRERYGFELF
jgi:hypothetical protein